MEQDCTQFAVLILCHDSTGCDETGDYFATEAHTKVDISRLTWIKIAFEYIDFNRNIYQFVSSKCELLFSICMSIYFSIIGIREYVIIKIIYNIYNTNSWACK